jgi:hypothetical protein
MKTTLPTREADRSTKRTELPAFDAEPAWAPEESPEEDTAPSQQQLAPEEERTTKQWFDRAEVLRRRYFKDWRAERRPRFLLKQEWIGRVDEVRDETFLASLVTRSAPTEVEHAEIEIDEVAPDDRGRLRRGAVFYWVVGYRDEPHGQRLGVSSILFRTMTELTEDQLERAQGEAERALAFLEAADSGSPNGSS